MADYSTGPSPRIILCMGKYGESVKLLALALFALVLSFIWEDASLIAFLGFITFIIMAVQGTFRASQTFASKVKLLIVFSAVLALLIVLGLTLFNPPQCPVNYSQAQIDAAQGILPKCIIGANIGLPFYFLFVVLPVGLVVTALWIKTLWSEQKSSRKT